MSEVSGGAPAAPSAEISTSPAESQGQSASSPEFSGGQSAQVDAIQEAVESGDISQAEAKSMIKKLQLKVNGKIIEREVDLGDEDFLRNQFQLAEVSKQSMQKAAEQDKLFRQLLEGGRNDVAAFMQEAFGIDPDDWAAAHIEKKIEHLKKSPEVLAQEKLQAELAQAREEAKKLKEEKENAEMSKLQQETLSGLREEISSAIKTHTKLPDSKYVQQKMAQALMWAEDNGFPGATAEDIAPMVESEMRKEMNELYDLMPEELIESMIGRKNIDRLRKSKIAKAKEVPSVNAVKQTAVQKPAEAKKAEPIDAKRFWRGR